VRPYVLTGGRTRPVGPILALDTTVRTTTTDSHLDPQTPESSRILELCDAPTSIAELAGRLTIPVGVVRVLVDDLGTLGAVTVNPPTPAAATDAGLLERLLDGIRAL
jgi:hypothetical protein